MNRKLLFAIATLGAATSSGAMASATAASDPIRGIAVIARTDAGVLQIADLRPGSPALNVPLIDAPIAVLVNTVTGTSHVLNRGTPPLLVSVDTESGRVVHRTTVGRAPSALAADFPSGELYVANAADRTVSILHEATMKTIRTLALSGAPSALSVDPRRRLLYVVSSAERTVDVIDLDYRVLASTIAVGSNPGTAIIDEVSGKAYVNNIDDNTISVIDPGSLAVVATLPSGSGSTSGTISPIHRRYYLPNALDDRLTVIDTRTDRIVAFIPVGRSPKAAVLSVTEDLVYVANHGDPSMSIVDNASLTLVGTVRTGSRPDVAFALKDRLVIMQTDGFGETVPVDVATSFSSETALATEYVDAVNHRYLHTASALEARLIADGLYGDEWRRSMRVFRVWTKTAEGRVPVCRFRSVDDADSARVFAATASECDTLKASASWVDEGIAYFVQPPLADGSCAAGTEPLHRLYNQGRDGIPAHRYVRDAGVRATMTAAGWTAEGSGTGVVHACVPALFPGYEGVVRDENHVDVPIRSRPSLRYHHR